MSGHRFKKGDRVDYRGNGTPGTVTARTSDPDGDPAYRIKWDDGFKEPNDSVWANVWPDCDLEPEGEVLA